MLSLACFLCGSALQPYGWLTSQRVVVMGTLLCHLLFVGRYADCVGICADCVGIYADCARVLWLERMLGLKFAVFVW